LGLLLDEVAREGTPSGAGGSGFLHHVPQYSAPRAPRAAREAAAAAAAAAVSGGMGGGGGSGGGGMLEGAVAVTRRMAARRGSVPEGMLAASGTDAWTDGGFGGAMGGLGSGSGSGVAHASLGGAGGMAAQQLQQKLPTHIHSAAQRRRHSVATDASAYMPELAAAYWGNNSGNGGSGGPQFTPLMPGVSSGGVHVPETVTPGPSFGAMGGGGGGFGALPPSSRRGSAIHVQSRMAAQRRRCSWAE
jgi:hypothetical protein